MIASLLAFTMASAAFRFHGLPSTHHHLMAFVSYYRTSSQSHSMIHYCPSKRYRFISKKSENDVFHNNRYDRFRACLRLAVSNDSHSEFVNRATQQIYNTVVANKDDNVDPMYIAKCSMEIMSSNRRSFNRTWERMSPLIQLILLPSKSPSNNKSMNSIADVGCDHGMLALSLACIALAHQSYDESDRVLFSQVLGTDLSKQALENGGLVSLKKVNDALSRISMVDNDLKMKLPIQFRVGNGLDCLQPNEADGIVIAGMGVHTMLDTIILGTTEASTAAAIERIDSDYLFLQPTNSRPQHLIMLYDGLQNQLGWELKDERIAFVGGRWYISSYFHQNDDTNSSSNSGYRFPGHYLLDDDIFDTYVKHHLKWLKQVSEKGPLVEEDTRWVQHISSLVDKNEWKLLAEWYTGTELME